MPNILNRVVARFLASHRPAKTAVVNNPRQMEQMFEEALIALNHIEASAEDFGFSPKGAAEARKIMLQSYREWGAAKRARGNT